MGLSKVLDSIPHYLLMVKLNAYSFDRKYLVFFYSYLNWRRQQVNVNNIQSTFEALRSRVPQGSTLGPLLFDVFISDLIIVYRKTDGLEVDCYSPLFLKGC